MTHELKTWPEYFQCVFDCTKRFEFRDSFDRDFQVGDTLVLREWDPKTKQYSGRTVTTNVTYILPVFGTYKILSLGPIAVSGRSFGLNSCPFCGGFELEFRRIESEDEPGQEIARAVFCRNCRAIGRHWTRAGWTESDLEALQAWNSRQPAKTPEFATPLEWNSKRDACPDCGNWKDHCECRGSFAMVRRSIRDWFVTKIQQRSI